MTKRLRAYVCLTVFGASSSALAQRAPRDSVPAQDTIARAPATPSRAWPECQPGPDMVRSELLALDRHAGWGLALGTVAGIAYGAATSGGRARGIVMVFDGFIGMSAGFMVGSVVYLIRRATGYRPTIQPRCVSSGRWD
jgi:hypothetical protein